MFIKMIEKMILQIFLILVIFIAVSWYSHMQVERWGLPSFLQYRPFNCKICLTFWLLMAVYGAAWLILGFKITAIGGWIMAILNAIAMKVDQKQKTVDVNNYHITEEEK